MQSRQECLRVLLVGAKEAGSSKILSSIARKNENFNLISTSGYKTEDEIQVTDDFKVKVQIWDIQDVIKNRTNSSSYYKGIDIIFCTFDFSNEISYKYLPHWIKEAMRMSTEAVVINVLGLCVKDTKPEITDAEVALLAEIEGVDNKKINPDEYNDFIDVLVEAIKLVPRLQSKFEIISEQGNTSDQNQKIKPTNEFEDEKKGLKSGERSSGCNLC